MCLSVCDFESCALQWIRDEMLSSNGNPFLRAEYLNPPPATNTMDSKKSPLALLAQTCSQIGADPTPTTATKTASSTMTTTTTTGHPSGESRKKSASECLAHDNRHEPRGSPSASVVSSPEANNNRVAQQQQRPASSANDAGQSLPNAATQTLKTASIKKASDVSSNPNRLTPTDRRSKSTSPKNRSNAGASSGGVGPPHPTQAVDHPSASTASTSAAFMNHLLLHPSQQQLVGGSHPSHHHNQQQHHQHHHLMMAAALAHGSSDASSSSSSSAAAAMSLANSYKSLMAASAGMAYSSGHPSSMSPYPHSPYSPHHHASVAGAGAGAGASAGYGPPHPSAIDFGAYANALNAAAVAKSTSSASSGHPFIATSAATAAMMNGYLAGHPAYSVAALQQAMHQQHYGNAAARMASSSSSAFSSSSAAALVQSKPTNSNAESACRDPYCTGCPASSSNNNNVAASSSSAAAAAAAAGQIHMVCTVGCPLSVQCEHMKVPMAAHHLQMLSAPGASSPGSANGQPPPSSPHHNNSNSSNNVNNVNNRPYICNWIVADNYCGKRFASSDDLLQHLRTHTNLSSAAAAAAAAPPPESAPTSSATGFAHPSSMMRAAYPTPPLSPLSAARYHPYGKANGSTTTSATSLPAQQQQQQQPGPFPSAVAGLFHPGMAAAMAAMASGGPYGAGPPPPSAAAAAAAAAAHLFHMNPALAPYYSHLSLFAHQTNNQASTRQMPGLGPAPLGGGGLGGQP